MDDAYVPMVKWSNVGFWIGPSFMRDFGMKTPWGNLIFKHWRDRLFSERYGHRKGIKIGGLFITWVRLRRSRNEPVPF